MKNPNGVVKDHRYSIFHGFTNKIDPNFLKHPANCELMLPFDNFRKSYNSSVSLDELKEEIIQFDLILTENKI